MLKIVKNRLEKHQKNKVFSFIISRAGSQSRLFNADCIYVVDVKSYDRYNERQAAFTGLIQIYCLAVPGKTGSGCDQ
jgi:hypothetical protein